MSTYTSKTKTGATLTVYYDTSDPQDEGWAWRCGGDSGRIDDFTDLATVLREHSPDDLDGLLTFGGAEPDDTGVWSWDETSLLVGACIRDLKIVNRPRSDVDADDIQQLRDEAAAAGDHVQVEVCDRALANDAEAWNECHDVIADARAQRDA